MKSPVIRLLSLTLIVFLFILLPCGAAISRESKSKGTIQRSAQHDKSSKSSKDSVKSSERNKRSTSVKCKTSCAEHLCRSIDIFHNITVGTAGPADETSVFPENFDATVIADYYVCHSSLRRTISPPLVIFFPGAPASKSSYTMFASGLAAKGYVVAVVDHWVSMQAGPSVVSMNGCSPFDIYRILAHVNNQDDFAVNSDQVIVMGHSFGGAMGISAASEICLVPFCPPGTTISLPTKVKLLVGYGTSVFAQGLGGAPMTNLGNLVLSRNKTVPVLAMFGQGEKATIETWPPENSNVTRFQFTFDQFHSPKLFLIAEGLDHDSIADHVVSTRNWMLSQLPRETQVQMVVNTFSEWIDATLRGNIDSDMCDHFVENDIVEILEAEDGTTMCFQV